MRGVMVREARGRPDHCPIACWCGVRVTRTVGAASWPIIPSRPMVEGRFTGKEHAVIGSHDKKNRGIGARRAGLLCLSVVSALMAGIAGCTSTTNYPEIEGATGTFEDPNEWRTVAAMIVAVRYVGNRYEPGHLPQYNTIDPAEAAESMVAYPFVLNAPPGLRKVYYDRLCREVGESVEPMNSAVAEQVANNQETDTPVIHIGRVWIREQRAEVDVYRPMPELDRGRDGKLVYQMVTVRLSGGIQPWRAVHARAWAPGAFATPPTYVIPQFDRPDQYRVTKYELEQQGIKNPTPPEIDQPSIEEKPEGLREIDKF